MYVDVVDVPLAGKLYVYWENGKLSGAMLNKRYAELDKVAEKGNLKRDLPKVFEYLSNYSSYEKPPFSVDLLNLGKMSIFASMVYRQLFASAKGQVFTYGQLAAIAGSPKAARAVGSLMAKNKFVLIVPCHRVVSVGALGSYSAGGVGVKLKLLENEGVDTSKWRH
ncbi:hypothetical protein RsTz2092_09040 [Deferribacterales bacterium RsTz2092]